MLEESKSGVPPGEENIIRKVAVEVGDVTEEVAFYNVSVSNGFNSWVVKKRYSQFEDFHNNLANSFPKSDLPPLPPKKFKWLISHSDPSFLEERRALLENYFTHLLTNKEYSSSNLIMQFFNNDKVADKAIFHPTPAEDPNLLAQIPDDQEVTDVTIPSTRSMSDHVLYQIDVVNAKKRKTFSKWTILKRFQQVFDMDVAVRATLPESVLDKLPECPKREPKLLQDHMDKQFVEMRRALLQNYLRKMLAIPAVARNQAFLSFLGAV